MRKRRCKLGLTLLEVMMVVILLGIVAAVVLPRIMISRQMARENLCFQYKREINMAIERYFQDHAALPATLADLDDFLPAGVPDCPVSESAYTLNPTNTRISGHTSGSH